jgi:hypothetical protein
MAQAQQEIKAGNGVAAIAAVQAAQAATRAAVAAAVAGAKGGGSTGRSTSVVPSVGAELVSSMELKILKLLDFSMYAGFDPCPEAAEGN